jgi:hypothetical protein
MDGIWCAIGVNKIYWIYVRSDIYNNYILFQGSEIESYTFFQAHMPDAFGAAMYLEPSLPVIVLPQHLFAGYGGLGRVRYFLVVCIAHLVPLIRLCTRFQYWRELA